MPIREVVFVDHSRIPDFCVVSCAIFTSAVKRRCEGQANRLVVMGVSKNNSFQKYYFSLSLRALSQVNRHDQKIEISMVLFNKNKLTNDGSMGFFLSLRIAEQIIVRIPLFHFSS